MKMTAPLLDESPGDGYLTRVGYADIETASDDYASRFAGKAGQWLLNVQERIIAGFVSAALYTSQEQLSVLDVGGGHGQVVAALAHRPYASQFHITVLGSAAEANRQLISLPADAQSALGHLQYQIGEFTPLPFPDQSFDIVTCFRLLPHFDDWRALLRELCRVTKRCLLFDAPTFESINALSAQGFSWKKRIEKNTRTFTLFHRRELLAELEKNGFPHADIRGQFTLPMVVHRMLKSPVCSELLELPGRISGLVDVLGSPIIMRATRGE